MPSCRSSGSRAAPGLGGSTGPASSRDRGRQTALVGPGAGRRGRWSPGRLGRWCSRAAAGLAGLAVGPGLARPAQPVGRAARRRAAAVDLLASLAAELRGGAEPRVALAAAAGPRAPGGRGGGPQPGGRPGWSRWQRPTTGVGLLADLAAAWRVVELTGARLAGPAARLAEAARADEAVRREVAAQLAGPRATALLLALLPCAGVLLGTALGADPAGFLLDDRARAAAACSPARCWWPPGWPGRRRSWPGPRAGERCLRRRALAALAGLLAGDDRPVGAARLHRAPAGSGESPAGRWSGCWPSVPAAGGSRAADLGWPGRWRRSLPRCWSPVAPEPRLLLVVVALWLGVPPARRRRQAAAARAVVDRDLPRAADLTATCLEAGAAPADALGRVADAIGGPVGCRLRAVSLAVRAGADLPRGQIAGADDADPLAALLRAVARATATGAPLADTVRDVAADAARARPVAGAGTGPACRRTGRRPARGVLPAGVRPGRRRAGRRRRRPHPSRRLVLNRPQPRRRRRSVHISGRRRPAGAPVARPWRWAGRHRSPRAPPVAARQGRGDTWRGRECAGEPSARVASTG